MTYRAAAGWRNAVRVEVTASDVVITDTAADLTAGGGCVALTIHGVSCAITVDPSNPDTWLDATADAGDLDDSLTAVTPLGDHRNISLLGGAGNDTLTGIGDNPGPGALLDGGPGNDVLIAAPAGQALLGGPGRDTLQGGAGSDSLYGGPGRDVLHAGAGDDYLDGDGRGSGVFRDFIDGGPGRDIVSYRGARANVVVDLAAHDRAGRHGERDRLRSIEDVEGGHGNDVISGDKHANSLIGGGGADRLSGRGGPDVLSGDDADRLDGGTGDDSLFPLAARGVVCGPGQDAVQAPDINQAALVHSLNRSCEWFSMNRVWIARRATVEAGGVHLRVRSTLDMAVPIPFVITRLNGGVVLGATHVSIPARSVTRVAVPLNAGGRRFFRRHPTFFGLLAESPEIGVVFEGPLECTVRL